ncbi:Fe-S protein assembly co-chaperone HscB [Buchnera aphidicola]|uniref:Fe-S protein assembly co-chaperone HscB n=1 Tax=Buchnera aphidicola TaxID=9 RepID=UPI0031B6C49C
MNYFKLFNLPEIFDINIEQLNKNFYRLQKKFHPDVYIKDDILIKNQKKKKIFIINEGYRNLKNPLHRINHIFILNKLNYKDKKKYPLDISSLEQQFKLNSELEHLKSKKYFQNEIIFFIKKNKNKIQNLFKKIAFNILKKNWRLSIGLYQELRFFIKLVNQAEEIKKNKDIKNLF